jgi:hypothetical protein
MNILILISVIVGIILYIAWYRLMDKLVKQDDTWLLVVVYSTPIPAGLAFYFFMLMVWITEKW